MNYLEQQLYFALIQAVNNALLCTHFLNLIYSFSYHILYKIQNAQVLSFQEMWQLAFLIILSTPGSCANYL